MISSRIKLILEDKAVLEDTEEVETLKEYLVNIDENSRNLSLYELESIWRMFSGEHLTDFLVVYEDTVLEFINWLGKETRANESE